MKISYISTYPPHQCGIATFTENLVKAMTQSSHNRDEAIVDEIVAVRDAREKFAYPSEVNVKSPKNALFNPLGY
jgi:hypothetical protein